MIVTSAWHYVNTRFTRLSGTGQEIIATLTTASEPHTLSRRPSSSLRCALGLPWIAASELIERVHEMYRLDGSHPREPMCAGQRGRSGATSSGVVRWHVSDALLEYVARILQMANSACDRERSSRYRRRGELEFWVNSGWGLTHLSTLVG